MTLTLRVVLVGLLMGLGVLLSSPSDAAAQAGGGGAGAAPVRVIELDGSIDQVAAVFVERRIDSAENAGAAAVVIRLDASGGVLSSTREVVADMREADVPVTVWVGPAGARAGSAGAVVAAAAGELGMAPGTSIGSDEPTGGRDLTADQAVGRGVADTVQPTLEGFVAWLDGRPGPDGPIRTAGAPLESDSLPWYLSVLRVLTDPNLVFFLLLLGLAGVGFEIFNPGAIVPAVVGAISLLLALTGLALLPFGWAGIALLVLAVVFFIAETQIGGVGALALGGVVALALGGAFLFDSDDPALQPSIGVVVATAAVVGGAFAVAARLVLRARRRPTASGGAELVGEVGRARATIGAGGGAVLVNGEIWSARPLAGVEIPAGEEVRVVTVHGDDLTLTVEPREG